MFLDLPYPSCSQAQFSGTMTPKWKGLGPWRGSFGSRLISCMYLEFRKLILGFKWIQLGVYTDLFIDPSRNSPRFVQRMVAGAMVRCRIESCYMLTSRVKIYHYIPWYLIVQNHSQMKSTKIGTHVFSFEILGVQCPVKPFPDLVPCRASPSHHHSTSPKNAQEVAGCFQVCVTRREVKWVYFP